MTQLRPEQNEGRKSRAKKQHLVLSLLFSTSSCTGEMRGDDDEVELSPVFFFRVGQTRVTEKYILY